MVFNAGNLVLVTPIETVCRQSFTAVHLALLVAAALAGVAVAVLHLLVKVAHHGVEVIVVQVGHRRQSHLGAIGAVVVPFRLQTMAKDLSDGVEQRSHAVTGGVLVHKLGLSKKVHF